MSYHVNYREALLCARESPSTGWARYSLTAAARGKWQVADLQGLFKTCAPLHGDQPQIPMLN